MFNLTFETENAAFEGDDITHETARILGEIAKKIESGDTSGSVRDINGNRVGSWDFQIPECYRFTQPRG